MLETNPHLRTHGERNTFIKKNNVLYQASRTNCLRYHIYIFPFQIPCKHVFCLSCAKREDKVCPRCMEKVSRVEQTGLGTVFMCTHGGTRYGNAGCRRTYLSQRDLQVSVINSF